MLLFTLWTLVSKASYLFSFLLLLRGFRLLSKLPVYECSVPADVSVPYFAFYASSLSRHPPSRIHLHRQHQLYGLHLLGINLGTGSGIRKALKVPFFIQHSCDQLSAHTFHSLYRALNSSVF